MAKLAQTVNKFTKNRSLPGTITNKLGDSATIRVSSSGSLISNVKLVGGLGEVGDSVNLIFRNGIPSAETIAKSTTDIIPDTSTTRTKTTDPHPGHLEQNDFPERLDASAIMGIPIDDTAPTNGYVLSYDSATGTVKWVEASSGSGSSYTSLTNKSGSTVYAGDIVVHNTTANQSFTTGAYIGDNRVCGVVVASSIANDASGNVATLQGQVVSVNCTSGAVAIGDFLRHSGTTSLAESQGVFRYGPVIGMALSSKSAGSTGTVYCILLLDFLYGITFSNAYGAGGHNAAQNAATAVMEKFVFASATWSTLSGTLPANRSMGLGCANNGTSYAYWYGGSSTTAGTNAVNTSYKFTYSSETAAAMSSNYPGTRCYIAQGAAENTKCYGFGGYTSSAWSNTSYKMPFSTETWGTSDLGDLADAAERNTGHTDSTTYGYTVSVSPGSATRITFSSDTLAAQSGADQSTNVRWINRFNFTSTAGYGVSTNGSTYLSWKLTFSSGTSATLSNTSSTYTDQSILPCDNSNYSWCCSSGTSAYLHAIKFTRSSETYAADSGAQMNATHNSGASATVGVF